MFSRYVGPHFMFCGVVLWVMMVVCFCGGGSCIVVGLWNKKVG